MSTEPLSGEPFPEAVYKAAEEEVKKDRIADEHFNVRLNKAKEHEQHIQGASEENRAIYAAAEHWARIMQYEMRVNESTVADVADNALGQLRPGEMTVLNQMVGHLTRYWRHGEELRAWYREHTKVARKVDEAVLDDGPLVRTGVREAAQRWKAKLDAVIHASQHDDPKLSTDRIVEIIGPILAEDIKTHFPVKPHLRVPQVAKHLAQEWPEAAEALSAWMKKTAEQLADTRTSWARDVNTRLTPPDDERSL